MSPFVVCAFAIAAAGILSVLKAIKPELANIATAITGILVFVYILEGIIPLIEFIKISAAATNTEAYFTLMLKALAVSFCCKTSAEICRDCGENSLASRVELSGRVSIVIISLPVIQQLFDMAKDMM